MHKRRIKALKSGLHVTVVLLSMLFSASSRAEVTAGAGMEYYTVKVMVEDVQGEYYHTMLQSTLASVQITYAQRPWFARLQAGTSKWNVSGEWKGTNLDTISIDPFFWAGQESIVLEGKYQFWGAMAVGLQFSSRTLEHYSGRTGYRFMYYQLQSITGLVEWEFLQAQDVTASIAVVYAPRAVVDFYKSLYFIEDDFLVTEYQEAGVGTQWQGCLKMEYRDSAGWGLDFLYQFRWFEGNALGEISRLTIKSGSLLGTLLLRF
ncbi:hypothetical protein KAR34_04415 [bacterium]|nr:hypothetical protein [bacterium]